MSGKLEKKEIRGYIEEHLDSGHTVSAITDHLVKHGHKKEDIEAILDEILDEEKSRNKVFIKRGAEILFVALFVLFIFWVGVSSDSPGEAIIVGFLPTIIFIIISLMVVERRIRKDILIVLPVILGFLFYISGALSSIEVLQKMELAKVTLLNIFLSYVFIGLMEYMQAFSSIRIPFIEEIFGSGEDEIRDDEMHVGTAKAASAADSIEEMRHMAGETQKHEAYIQIPEKHEPLNKVLESIESNSKALNSVIGRVYRKSSGGTSLVRDLIHIKPEWYNTLSGLIREKNDMKQIYDVTDRIEKRLEMLFRKEHELFGIIQFKNLRHDPNGNDRIIDVLVMNDNDPVETYFENALKACGEAKEIIGAVK